MSLLRQIQDAASSPQVRTADLLRRCKILAARLKSAELGNWADLELMGYPNEMPLPDYRVLPLAEARGQFVGMFGSQMNNALIPTMGLPDYARKWAHNIGLRDGVSVYDDLVARSEKGSHAQRNWPIDVVNVLEADIGLLYQGMHCAQAWSVIPNGVLVNLLDTVRNKILNFSLDIEKQNPAAGEADPNTEPIPAPAVQNTFNNHFHSPVGNVAQGSHDFDQKAVVSQSGDGIDMVQLAAQLSDLRVALLKEATTPEQYAQIGAVAEAELAAKSQDSSKALACVGKFGHWVGDMASKIGATILAHLIEQAAHMKP